MKPKLFMGVPITSVMLVGNHKETVRLLKSANKWVRWVEEHVPQSQLRHGADPKPLRREIEKHLSALEDSK